MKVRRGEDEPAPVLAGVRPETEEKRRWALTVLVVVLAAGAASARAMHRRSR
jgi:hypothetical protein